MNLQSSGFFDAHNVNAFRLIDNGDVELGIKLLTLGRLENHATYSLLSFGNEDSQDAIFPLLSPTFFATQQNGDNRINQKRQTVPKHKQLPLFLKDFKNLDRGESPLELMHRSKLDCRTKHATIFKVDDQFVSIPLAEIETSISLEAWEDTLRQVLNEFALGNIVVSELNNYLLMVVLGGNTYLMKTVLLMQSCFRSILKTAAVCSYCDEVHTARERLSALLTALDHFIGKRNILNLKNVSGQSMAIEELFPTEFVTILLDIYDELLKAQTENTSMLISVHICTHSCAIWRGMNPLFLLIKQILTEAHNRYRALESLQVAFLALNTNESAETFRKQMRSLHYPEVALDGFLQYLKNTRNQESKKVIEHFAYFILAEPILFIEFEKRKKPFSKALNRILETKSVTVYWESMLFPRSTILRKVATDYATNLKQLLTFFENQKRMAFKAFQLKGEAIMLQKMDVLPRNFNEVKAFLADTFEKCQDLVTVGNALFSDEMYAGIFFESLDEWSRNPKILHGGMCCTMAAFIIDEKPSVLTEDGLQKLYEFFVLSVNSLLLLSPLMAFFSCFKRHFSAEQKETVMKLLEERREAEKLFASFFCLQKHRPTIAPEIDEHFRECASKFPFAVFAVFTEFFIISSITASVESLAKDIHSFRVVLHQVLPLRKIFFKETDVRKMLHGAILSGSGQLPVVELESIFNKSWPEIYAADIIGKPLLGHYKKELLISLRLLGKGAQGEVELVTAPNIPTPVVAKIIKNDYEVVARELDTLMRIQIHPHVVHIYGFVVQFGDHVGILMEYCEGGSLEDAIIETEDISEKHILWWCLQATSGLSYLHTNKITHRDVKPLNMLLNHDRSHLKIADLGLIKKPDSLLIDDTTIVTEAFNASQLSIDYSVWPGTDSSGTPGYRAPEIFAGEGYTSFVDVFSMGRSIWQMVFKTKPENELVESTWFENGITSNLKPAFTLSDNLLEYAKRMMADEPHKRGSMENAYDLFSQLYANF